LIETLTQKNPYWQVNLLSTYNIKTIKLILNKNKLSKFKNFFLQVRKGSKLTWQYKFKGFPSTSIVVIDVPKMVSENKLKLLLKGKNRMLELREAEVIADDI